MRTVLVVVLILGGCQTLDTEVIYFETAKDPCSPVAGYESPNWANGQAWNNPETSCI